MNKEDTQLYKLLTGMGFEGTDARVYESLLGLESVSVRKASVASGINRGTTYESMKRLVAAGLISTHQRGQREYFVAESPEALYAAVSEKKKDLQDTEKLVKEVVPQLQAKRPQTSGKPLVRYFEDDEGVVTILKDVLATSATQGGSKYYVYSSRQLRSYLYRKFPHFTERRVKQGVSVDVIAVGEGGEPEPLSARKWMPTSNSSPTGSYTIIYGNKVAHISLADTFIPYGVVIEDSSVAAMQRLQFEQLWKTL